jgi:hypothetical protein
MLYQLILVLLLIAIVASYLLAYLYKFIQRSYQGKWLFLIFAFLGITIGYLIIGVTLYILGWISIMYVIG